MKEREEEQDGKGKEVVDEEGVSWVRQYRYSHDTKLRSKEEVDTYRAVTEQEYMDGLLPVDENPLLWWKKHDPTFFSYLR